MKRIAALITGVLLVATMATAAIATPPDRYDLELSWTELYMPCDGFDVLGEFSATIAGTVFFDNDGVAIRNTEHWKMTAEVYRADGIGTSLFERDAWNNTFVPPDTNPDGPFVSTGATWNLTVPGYGVVYKVTGYQVWDWSQWPPYSATGWNLDAWTAPDAATAICGYFGDMS